MHNEGEKFCTQCGTKLMAIREYQEFRYKNSLNKRFCRLDDETLDILSKYIKKEKEEKEKEEQRIRELIEIGKSTSTLYGPSNSQISRAEEKKYFRDLYR